MNRLIVLFFILLVSFTVHGSYNKQQTTLLIVGQQQQFKTIQSAIDASTNFLNVVIFIKPGIYDERLFITRNNIALVGESAQNTIVKTSILREQWRKLNPSDWGSAAVNINATDVSLINLSIVNEYGLLTGNNEHQFAVRGFELSDKIITHNCSIVAGGADTLSLWNKNGRYYHSHCYFEGHTDFVCPRGTALIENAKFYNQKRSATIWHDGELNPNYKLVVSDSEFDGIEGFWLARHHYDAQFYLLNSRFSKNMADKPIFKKRYNNKSEERPNLYGQRYFFDSNRSENKLTWLEDNFNVSDLIPKTYPNIEAWVFENTWQPNKELSRLSQFLTENLNGHKFEPFNINTYK